MGVGIFSPSVGNRIDFTIETIFKRTAEPPGFSGDILLEPDRSPPRQQDISKVEFLARYS